MEKSRKIYMGINQTRTINCTVLRANPTYIRYTLNGLSSSIIHRSYGDQNNLYYTFDITPTSIEQFRLFNVTANNSVGFDTCTYELIHGGKYFYLFRLEIEYKNKSLSYALVSLMIE
jgi:hypothetical protein